MRVCFWACLLILGCWGTASAEDAVSAGGQWLKSDIMDAPTSTKAVEFALSASEAELGRSPEIQFICTGDGKAIRVRYFADTSLRPTIGDYRNYQMPAISPKITLDKKKHFSAVWDVFPDRKSAILDTKTIRAMLDAKEMMVRYRDKEENHFADLFVVEGLNKTALQRACGNNGWFEK